MSWGTLRLQLVAGAPGVDPDLVDGWINARYARVLDHFPWKELELETVLSSVAAYNTGTVNATLGSAAVVGVGTTFAAGMTGQQIAVSCGGPLYTVTFVDATDITLDRPYEGTTVTGAGFVIFQSTYTLPPDAKTVLTVQDPSTGLPLVKRGREEIRDWAQTGCEPTGWAMAADTAESPGPVYHTLRLDPPPTLQRGYPLRYLKAALGFSGENTGGNPLPFVPDKILLDGVRADIQLHLKSFQGAQMYETKFGDELIRMLRVDTTRRKQVAKMPAHYTRYRMRRCIR